MRVEYDASHDQAYVYVREIESAGVAKTVTLVAEPPDTENYGINLDFDHEGRLVGIEVDGGASRRLPPELLAGAKRL
jgi:uncharacterized protein YuzE